MSAIIPFEAAGRAVAPAYLQRFSRPQINDDIQTGPSFKSLSIKGKVFAVVDGGERQVLTKPGEPDEVAQSINVVVLRLNAKARTYYAERFVDSDVGEAKRPTCYSIDGIAPQNDSEEIQSTKCALCPHAVFGSAVNEDGTAGKGTACRSNVRMAVATPDNPKEPYLLRVPPKSIKGFKRDFIKVAKDRGVPYNALVVRLGFDRDEAAPVLTFRPVGFLPEDAYAVVDQEMYDSDLVREIIGTVPFTHEAPEDEAPAAGITQQELDAAAAARKAVSTASSKAKPAAAKADPKVDADELNATLYGAGQQDTPVPTSAPTSRAKPAAKPAAPPKPAAPVADESGEDEDDEEANLKAALAAIAAKKAARARANTSPSPTPAATPANATATKPAASSLAADSEADGLIGELNDMLGGSDD
jgi:hypothetical protein